MCIVGGNKNTIVLWFRYMFLTLAAVIKWVYSESLQDIFCLPARYDVDLRINAKSDGMIYISDFGSLHFRSSNL